MKRSTEIKLRILVERILKEETGMTYQEACEEAKRISKSEGVVQHVEEVGNGRYIVSDWYDSDKTVKSYENGREK